MMAIEIFVRGFILTSQIRNTGRTPNVQSAAALTAECAYVAATIAEGVMHDPPEVVGFQKYEMGLHWRRMKKK